MASRNHRRVAGAFFVGALVVAGSATWGIVSILRGTRAVGERAGEPVDVVRVVTASRTLYQGVTLSNDDLFVVNLPLAYLPVMRDPAHPKDQVPVELFHGRERVVGQIPRERILANEFVRPERLADGVAGIGLHAFVPRGMRAMSVGLKGADAVSGFLVPGSYVDILVTMKDELGDQRTETILQAVFVMGVNSRGQHESAAAVGERGTQSPSVTFLVTPRQAEEIAYADEIGALSLTMRNIQDIIYTTTDGASMADLIERITDTSSGPVARFVDTAVRSRVGSAASDSERGTFVLVRGPERTIEEYDPTGR